MKIDESSAEALADGGLGNDDRYWQELATSIRRFGLLFFLGSRLGFGLGRFLGDRRHGEARDQPRTQRNCAKFHESSLQIFDQQRNISAL